MTDKTPQATPTAPAATTGAADVAAWRRHIGRVASLVLLLLLAQVALAAAVDARGELGANLVPPLVATDRAAKLDLLDALHQAPGTLILGSSRATFLDPAAGADHGYPAAFNGAMRGGRLDDALAAYRYAAATHGAPDRVLLALDPHQLSRSLTPNIALHRDDRLGPYAPGDLPATAWAQWVAFAVIDPGITKDTYRALAHAATGGANGPGTAATFGADGGWRVADPHPLAPPALAGWVDRRVSDYAFFTGADADRIAQLRDLVAAVTNTGARLDIIITPERAVFRAALDERTPYGAARAAVLERLQDACAAPGVAVHDLADAVADGTIRDAWFTDGEHLLRAASPTVWAAVADGDHDLCRP